MEAENEKSTKFNLKNDYIDEYAPIEIEEDDEYGSNSKVENEYGDMVFPMMTKMQKFKSVADSYKDIDTKFLKERGMSLCVMPGIRKVNDHRQILKILQIKYNLLDNHIIETLNKFKTLMMFDETNKLRIGNNMLIVTKYCKLKYYYSNSFGYYQEAFLIISTNT